MTDELPSTWRRCRLGGMVWRGLASVCFACALVGACGKTDGSGAPSDNSPSAAADAAELEAWQRAYAEALCAQDRDCPNLGPRQYASVDACMDQNFDNLRRYSAYYGSVDYFLDWSAVYRVGTKAAQERCLNGLAACERAAEAGCGDVRSVRAPGKQGSVCWAGEWHTTRPCGAGLFCNVTTCVCESFTEPAGPCSGQECGPEQYCRRTYIIMGDVIEDGPSYCARYQALDESCGDLACRPPLVCSSGRCREPAGPNEPCTSTYDCQAFHVCDHDVCTRAPDRVGAGEPCSKGGGCALPLMCQNDVCTDLAADGASCGRGPRNQATACRHWCVFDAPDAVEGRCSDAPPTTGPTPCTIYRWDSSMRCPAGTHPDTHGEQAAYPNLPAYCQCEPEAEASSSVCE